MSCTHTIRLLAATGLGLLLSTVMTSSAATAPTTTSPGGTWSLAGLSAPDRSSFLTTVAMTIGPAKQVLRQIEGSITIDTNVAACAVGDSCASPPTGATIPWRIHLSAAAAAGNYPSQRFMKLHEIGHVVWGLAFVQRDRDAFVAAVERSLDGKPCRQWRMGGPCAVVGEMFADEFARWAGGFSTSMTSYETPALLSTATFTELVDNAGRSSR
jgi:hypothetical protein